MTDLNDFIDLLIKADRAAHGDSNGDEIEALQEVRDEAMNLLGIVAVDVPGSYYSDFKVKESSEIQHPVTGTCRCGGHIVRISGFGWSHTDDGKDRPKCSNPTPVGTHG